MDNNIKIDLKNAKNEYGSKNYEESLKIFEELYNENPEDFNKYDLISYCWAIYQVHIKAYSDEDELFDAAELITSLIPQADLNYSNTCPYTFSVFSVLDYLNDNKQYYNMSYWLSKLNPDLLDDKNTRFKSRKEKFYDLSSKSSLECAEWESCIEVSTKALNSLDNFSFNGDIWHMWRIAKSLKELNRNKEALEYLNEVVRIKKDWFVFKEIAENYCILGENEKALEYVCKAVLTDTPVNMKVNLHYLAFKLLEETNPEISYKHAELYYLIKSETGAEISQDIEELMIDSEQLDKNQLINEINQYWMEFRFKNKELQHGTISNFIENKNYGFILDENDQSIFFHKSEFEGDNIYVGQYVSFYTEKSYDKLKNKESVKAVYIRGE